jgi:hypothetical protein
MNADGIQECLIQNLKICISDTPQGVGQIVFPSITI